MYNATYWLLRASFLLLCSSSHIFLVIASSIYGSFRTSPSAPPRLLFLKTYIIPLLSHHTSSLFVRSVLLFRFLAHKQVSYEQLFTFFELNMADGRLHGNCWALLSCISLAAQEFNISYAHRGTK